MPAKYKRCVGHLKAKGHSTSSSHAICTASNAGNVKEYRARKKKPRVRSPKKRK